MDPILETALTFAGEKVVAKAIELLPSNTKKVGEAWSRMMDETVLEVGRALREHLALHEKGDPRFSEKVRDAMGERETLALLYRLSMEAAQATTRDRMGMLARALAGLFTPNLSTEMRSRVSRAVIALEPSDVVALRRALRMEPSKGTNKIGGEPKTFIPMEVALEGLLLAGCVADANVFGGGVYVTELGEAVAGTLAEWEAGVRPP